jgi:type I restriction enzyme S subunit
VSCRLFPKLRFPEFQDEPGWELSPLSQFIESLDAGVSVNSGDTPAGSKQQGILKTSAVTSGVFEPNENKIVLSEDERARLAEPVTADTIIISRMNTPELVGANAYVAAGIPNVFLPDRLWAAKAKPNVSMRFLSLVLGADKCRAALRQLAKGSSGSMKNITKPDVLKLLVAAPALAEQREIAECLSTLDKLIEAESEKLAALKTHKKGLMQQLFPREGEVLPILRFPEFRTAPDWDVMALGNLSSIVRGGSPRPIDGFLTTDSDGLNWLKIGDVDREAKFVTHTAERVRPEALAKTREVFPGDLILSNSMSFGRPYILDIKTCIHDGWIAVTKLSQSIDRDYLYYAFNSDRSQTFFKNQAAGSGVKNLNADIIKALPVCFPSLAEQQRISTCLSAIDDLITGQSNSLQALKRHKKGLMQQLFPAPQRADA